MQAILNFQQRVWPEMRQDLKWPALYGAINAAAAAHAYKLVPAATAKLFVATTAQLALRTLLPWRLAQRYLPEGTRFAFVVCVLMSAPTSFLGGMVAPLMIVGTGIAAAAFDAKHQTIFKCHNAARRMFKLSPLSAPTNHQALAANLSMVGCALGTGLISPLGAVCTLLAPPVGRTIAQIYTRLSSTIHYYLTALRQRVAAHQAARQRRVAIARANVLANYHTLIRGIHAELTHQP